MHRREKIEREAIEEHISRPQDQHHVADRPRLPRYSGSHSELLCETGGRLAEERRQEHRMEYRTEHRMR